MRAKIGAQFSCAQERAAASEGGPTRTPGMGNTYGSSRGKEGAALLRPCKGSLGLELILFGAVLWTRG